VGSMPCLTRPGVKSALVTWINASSMGS